MLDWAERYGLHDLVGVLSANSMYCADELTSYQIGPLGGPLYLPWNFDPKCKPPPAKRDGMLTLLRDRWAEIAGPEIAAVTRPIRLTGRKGRRLLVAARIDVRPPWGTWTKLAADGRRRHFTRLRAAINAALVPHEIDHVDFPTANTETET